MRHADDGVEVTVVIPAYGGAATIGRCLESLQAQAEARRAEVLLVESSGDGSADLVESRFPWVTVVRAPSRMSAGEARNHGATLAKGRCILFLDQDCLVPPGWMDRLVGHLSDERADAVGGSIGIADPENLSGCAVYFLEFLHHFPRRRAPGDSVPFLLGCNAGYRARVLRAVRFPDQTLGEDVLFSERARVAGFRVIYDPSIMVLHLNRSGWREFFRYARKMGEASAVYHGVLRRPWARPFLRWPLLVFPASLAVTPLVGWRLLWARPSYLGRFVLVVPMCLLGNLVWAAAFRRATLDGRVSRREAEVARTGTARATTVHR